MIRLWHVHKVEDVDDGWVVLAGSAEDARRLVLESRAASFAGELRRMRADPRDLYKWTRDATDEAVRRWYYWGIHLKPESPDPDTQVGEATEIVGGVFDIPFLGYSW